MPHNACLGHATPAWAMQHLFGPCNTCLGHATPAWAMQYLLGPYNTCFGNTTLAGAAQHLLARRAVLVRRRSSPSGGPACWISLHAGVAQEAPRRPQAFPRRHQTAHPALTACCRGCRAEPRCGKSGWAHVVVCTSLGARGSVHVAWHLVKPICGGVRSRGAKGGDGNGGRGEWKAVALLDTGVSPGGGRQLSLPHLCHTSVTSAMCMPRGRPGSCWKLWA
eukprot:352291-Chlamydomonas_euryale.AAC.1